MLFDSLPRPSVRVAPGVGHVPGWVGVDKQRALVEEMRGIAREYAGTPMAMVRPRFRRCRGACGGLLRGRCALRLR